MNGSKSLYGPERIARRHLKAAKCRGGINGVDVELFIQSIVVRQFAKAFKSHNKLRRLQGHYEALGEDISGVAKLALRTLYRDRLADVDLNLQNLTALSGTPLTVMLKEGSIASKTAGERGLTTVYELQRAILNNQISRRQANLIIAQLPRTVGNVVRGNLAIDGETALVATQKDSLTDLGNLKSRQIRAELVGGRKLESHKVEAKVIYKEPNWPEPEDWQTNIWRIKNPALRAIRLKALYKDIFCNERRHRFGLSNSSSCQGCGDVESVDHQLFQCRNASRMWDWISQITGIRTNSLMELVTVTEAVPVEILKSVAIKKLIQINRSVDCTKQEFISECMYYLKIEKIARKQSRLATACENLIRRLSQVT